MSSRGGWIVSVLVVVVLATACTESSSDHASSNVPSGSPAWLQVGPLPATCPPAWKFNPIEGSNQLMVPGHPTAAVSCSGQRYVHKGSQLTQLVHLLNSRRPVDPKTCIHNWGGMVLATTQVYFNYGNGEIEVVNFNPNCETMSNGKLTARFGQAASHSHHAQRVHAALQPAHDEAR